jgi:antitoxin component YwqK of YwqJK toxin-antitoxin module
MQFRLIPLVLIALSISFHSFSQPNTKINRSDWPDGEAGVDYNLLDDGGMRQGEWIRVWPSGTLYYKGQFKDDNPVGEFTFFYESGTVMTELNHANRGKRMFARHFREGGSLRAEGTYLESPLLASTGEPTRVKNGEWHFYDDGGTLRLKETYSYGELAGTTTSFHVNGSIVEQGAYSDDERDGTWKTFSETGQLLTEFNYSGGMFHGMMRSFYPTGRPNTIGLYEHGQEAGAWKVFTEEGLVERTIFFEDGEQLREVYENGLFETTFPDGRMRTGYSYKGGKKDGMFQEWHDVGEYVIVEETDPETGEILRRQILEGAELRREGEYIEGKLEGEITYYHISGRVSHIELYENGKLISTDKR